MIWPQAGRARGHTARPGCILRWTATLALLSAALLLKAGSVEAQSPPASGGPPPATGEAPPSGSKDLAKERFFRGKALFEQQTWAPALTEFLESRRLYATWSATSYAAACLKRLGRFDEALDMYATLIRDFGEKLPAQAKQDALREVEEARKLVGTIEIEGSEPGAAIVIDQQDHGDYPLLEPLRVPSGSHIVRVFKQGYEPFEKRLDVAGGTTARVAARLRKLKVTGTIQVIESTGREMEVFIDSIGVGKTPLKKVLAPGKHVVFMRGQGNFGTAPASVTVRANEVALLRLEAEQLDASLRVVPTPFDALVSIDSVALGRGLWDGRVRPGRHTVEVAAEGFLPEPRTILVGRGKREVVSVPLPRDPRSPFWRKPPPPPHFLVEMASGVPLYPSLGGDAATGCAEGCLSGVGYGAALVVRAGYELSSGVSFGLATGYLSTIQVIRDRSMAIQPQGKERLDTGMVEDSIRLRGTLVGAWVGYSLGDVFRLHLRLSAGGLLGAAADVLIGSSFSDSMGKPFVVGPFIQKHEARFFYVAPEVRSGVMLSNRLQLTAGIEAPVVIATQKPLWKAQPLKAGDDGYATLPAGSLTGSTLTLLVPSVGVRYDFD